MDDVLIAVLIAATLTSGLATGLLWGWAVSVMPALRDLPDPVFFAFLKRANVAIINGWFLSCYVGGLVLDVVAVILAFADGRAELITATLLASVLYLATVVITQAGNIPLNNRVEAATEAEYAEVRRAVERPWVRLNVVRSLTGIASVGVLCWALLVV